LQEVGDTIRQARMEIPAWAADPDFARDEAVLAQYIDVLQRLAANPAIQSESALLADSLRFAAWAKTHQPLAKASEPTIRGEIQ
jgi:hypothetical protein